jgi:hypothetical protein
VESRVGGEKEGRLVLRSRAGNARMSGRGGEGKARICEGRKGEGKL